MVAPSATTISVRSTYSVIEVPMPIYKYICWDCEKVSEVIRPMSQADDPLPCTACGGEHTKRQLSLFYAESGGKAVAGTSAPSCGSCSAGDCSSCGH